MTSRQRKVRLITSEGVVYTTIEKLMNGIYAKTHISRVDLCLMAEFNGVDVYENDVFGLNISHLADDGGFQSSNLGQEMKELGLTYAEVSMLGSTYELMCNYEVKFKVTETDADYLTVNQWEQIIDQTYVYKDFNDVPYTVQSSNQGTQFIKYLIMKGAKPLTIA